MTTVINRFFSVSLNAIQAHITRIGVLKLTINGELYSLFMNSGLSTRLSPALQVRLAQSPVGASAWGVATGSAGVLAGVTKSELTGNTLPSVLAGAAGSVAHGAVVHQDDKIMDEWRTSFMQVGIPVTGKPRLLFTALILGAILFLILIGTVLLSYLTTHK